MQRKQYLGATVVAALVALAASPALADSPVGSEESSPFAAAQPLVSGPAAPDASLAAMVAALAPNVGRDSASPVSTLSRDQLEKSGCGGGTYCFQLSADYAHYDPNVGTGANDWGGTATGFHVVDGFGLQGQLGYSHTTTSGAKTDTFLINGLGNYRFTGGQAGATVGYQSNRTDFGFGTSTRGTFNYAAFAEFYPIDKISIGASLGGFSGNFNTSGFAGAGEIKFYPTDNLSLSGRIDYTDFSHHFGSETDLSVKAQYAWNSNLGVYGGYSHTEFSNSSFTGENVYVGVDVYFDPFKNLKDRNRNGAVLNFNQFHPLEFKF